MSIKHSFNSGKSDDADATLVNPSDWNAAHDPALTTKGDIIVRDGSGAIRVGVGSDGQHLEAASGEASGVKWAAAAGALSFAGSNTTEATMTSATAADLITVSGLSIPAATPFIIVGSARKSTGNAADPCLGLKLNATTVIEAVLGDSQRLLVFGASDVAASGSFLVYVGPRVANYLRGLMRIFSVDTAGGGISDHFDLNFTANMPTATITDVIIRGDSDGTITLGVDEVFVYTLATS